MSSQQYEVIPVFPRLSLNDKTTRPETIRHHLSRYQYAAQYADRGLTVDVCSGAGYGTDLLRLCGGQPAYGIDLHAPSISYASEKYPDCQFIEGDVNDVLSSWGQRAMLVTFFEAIEHMPRADGKKIISSVARILDRDGVFILSTPRDIRSDVNPDHITQWGFRELRSTLEESFSSVTMLGQDWASGVISPLGPETASFWIAECRVLSTFLLNRSSYCPHLCR